MGTFVLPSPIQRRVEAAAGAFLRPEGSPTVDFSVPAGESALLPPDSVSWRIFKNPASLFIGGVAAVILELAESRVRAGVWNHTRFRSDPVPRLRRTGLAAMVSVYAPRSTAKAMIASVNRRHARIRGRADDGRPYAASDTDLLDWVQATASYGFIEAFHRFARPLSPGDRDRAWAEGAGIARLYGAIASPVSEAQWRAMLRKAAPALTPSPVIAEFLAIMRRVPALPSPLRPLQPLLVRAAVDLVPPDVARALGLQPKDGLSDIQRLAVCAVAAAAERVPLTTGPPAQTCVRMGLPPDWLYR